MKWRLARSDLLFVVQSLMPGRGDAEQAADLIERDGQLVQAMLDDDRLFQRLMTAEDILLRVSPWLFFMVLLRRARRELEREAFTVERRDGQKVVLFDSDRVVELLAHEPVCDYLAWTLASFTRVESVVVPIRVRRGVWHRFHTHELDVEGMVRYAQTTDEPFRFESYKRIADVCLFLTGMFPEYIDVQHRYPMSRQVRPRARGRACVSRADYEAYGRAFYRLAAEHEMARMEGEVEVLSTLSQEFVLAEKPLAFLANRYLQFVRHRVFGM